ncbi:D-alanyl-D-alanine carboxypeptidase family protein [Clostridium sp. UBA6640]|uniref:D-alanyl-D-alanine carboxypeptidase family protein n=1 Tax=Clostridium sp. UBA6640 TaxID=1946370 RepID=UPI0025C36A71|nr:hypothetical protein [Clostridium sp. UBA6640]
MAVYTARTIADNETVSIKESIQVFIDYMNQKAVSLGAVDSNFKTPDGYDTKGQYTTAQDIAYIAKACLAKNELLKIMSSYIISDTWLSGQEVTYYNTNELINSGSPYYNENVIGLKTGKSDKAGSCLVSAIEVDGKRFICVVMGSSDNGRWIDSLNFFSQIQ